MPKPPSAGKVLGIIAGGGALPMAIAQAARDRGRDVFVLGIAGMVKEADLDTFPHAVAGIGEFGKAMKLLREADCAEITFAGRVPRPKFSDVKLDVKGAMALPWVLSAARQGDDALMRSILEFFEKDGFRVVGSDEAAAELLAPEGCLGAVEPGDQDNADVSRAIEIVRSMGVHDIGQAAVVCEGVVLAVEAAEGTDAMLQRVAEMPETLRGIMSARRGVLVKAPKPNQERRVDLPVIGTATLDLASAAGLKGIAMQAGGALILQKNALIAAADNSGIFLLGFSTGEHPR
ncbi:MAG: UDP-2,3-diacylglucosamine diphosphatase LpxI [Micropepsaceae bacterium]